MTAYALLTYALQNDASGSLPVAKWLIAQRNPNGGFVSTQVGPIEVHSLFSAQNMCLYSHIFFKIYCLTNSDNIQLTNIYH